ALPPREGALRPQDRQPPGHQERRRHPLPRRRESRRDRRLQQGPQPQQPGRPQRRSAGRDRAGRLRSLRPMTGTPARSPGPVEALPEIVEVKRYLDGSEKRFHCRLIERDDRSAVLLYRSDRPYEVHGLALPAGTVTFGYYWVDRPHNVYHWQRPE